MGDPSCMMAKLSDKDFIKKGDPEDKYEITTLEIGEGVMSTVFRVKSN